MACQENSGAPQGLGTELWQSPGAQALDSPSRYHLIVIALIYFLPLVVMFVAYSVIGLMLWRRSVPGHQAHGANLRHLQAKKKVNSGGGGDGVRAGPEVWPRLGIGHSGPTPKRAPRSIDSACTLRLSQVSGQSLHSCFPRPADLSLDFGL